MADYKIIDISAWNSNVPYAQLKQYGLKGAIIRITEKGNKVDSKFETHWNGCTDNGLVCGVYKYSYAKTVDEIRQEAQIVLKTLNHRKCPLGVWLDVEDSGQIYLPKEQLKKMINAFAEIITSAGYHFGIYTGRFVWGTIGGKEMGYDYWIAAYPNNDTGVIVERLRPNIGEVGWQYSSKFKLNGGNTDISTFDKVYIDKLLNGVSGYTSTGSDAQKEVEKMATVSKVEKAVSWMEAIANDPSHGYDQTYRWNERGDYDCSSLTISAFEQAGIPVKTKGATYTGNMYGVFTSCGFKDVTKTVNLATGAGLIRGDVLLNTVHHVAVYCGNGKEVEASINERGGARGGTPGDQTGREILIRAYRNYPWTHVLRYPSTETTTVSSSASTKVYSTVKKGSAGTLVMELQSKLRTLGYNIVADGDFGSKTRVAVVDFQKKYGLEADGIVGPLTWAKLNSVVEGAKTTQSLNKTPRYTGKVTVNQLNVRTGAGTSYGILSAYPMLGKDNLIDVCDEVTAANGGKWYYVRIASKHYGYVSASYVVRV